MLCAAFAANCAVRRAVKSETHRKFFVTLGDGYRFKPYRLMDPTFANLKFKQSFAMKRFFKSSRQPALVTRPSKCRCLAIQPVEDRRVRSVRRLLHNIDLTP